MSPPKTPKTPKRVRLSLEQKQEICEASFKFGFNRLETAGKYGVSYQCISDTVKARHKILQQCDQLRTSKAAKNKKSFRKAKFEDEENILRNEQTFLARVMEGALEHSDIGILRDL